MAYKIVVAVIDTDTGKKVAEHKVTTRPKNPVNMASMFALELQHLAEGDYAHVND